MAFIHGTEVCVYMENDGQKFKPMHELEAGDVINVPVMQDGILDIYYTLKEEDIVINKYYKGLIYKLNTGHHITEDQIVTLSRLIEDHRLCITTEDEIIYFNKGNEDDEGKHYIEIREQLNKNNKPNELKILTNYTRVKAKDLNKFLKENNVDKTDPYEVECFKGNDIFPKEVKIEKIYEYEGVVHSIKTPNGLLCCRHNDDVFITGCEETDDIKNMKKIAEEALNDFKEETYKSLEKILEEKFNHPIIFPVTMVRENGVEYNCSIKYRDTRIDNCDKHEFNYILKFDIIKENKMLEFKFEDNYQVPEGWTRKSISNFFERWISYSNNEKE